MLDGALILDAWPRPLEDAPPVASFNLAQTSRGVPYVAGIRVAEEAPRACAICNEIKPADDMAGGPDRVSIFASPQNAVPPVPNLAMS
jgi:hypothetical protein